MRQRAGATTCTGTPNSTTRRAAPPRRLHGLFQRHGRSPWQGRRGWAHLRPRRGLSRRSVAAARSANRRPRGARRVRLAKSHRRAHSLGSREERYGIDSAGRRACRLGGRRRRCALRHGSSSGRQSGLRSRRQSLRHVQRHARASRAGVDLPGEAQRHARDVFVGHRESDIDGDLARWTAVRVEPLRRRRLSARRRRLGIAVCHRSRRRLRPRVCSGRNAVCRRPLRNDLHGRSQRTRQVIRFASVERGGLSPRARPRWVGLCQCADLFDLRRDLPRRRPRRRECGERAVRPSAGPGVR